MTTDSPGKLRWSLPRHWIYPLVAGFIFSSLSLILSPQVIAAEPSMEENVATVKKSPVNINTADENELQTIPGIGPGKALKIVERRQFKPFRSPWELRAYSGRRLVHFGHANCQQTPRGSK